MSIRAMRASLPDSRIRRLFFSISPWAKEGLLLLTSGLDNLTNDLPLHPLFVPFVEQTARYLSGTEHRSGSRSVDSLLELRTAKDQAGSVEIIDPLGNRPLSLTEATTQRRSLPADSCRAFYELRLANGRSDLIGGKLRPS